MATEPSPALPPAQVLRLWARTAADRADVQAAIALRTQVFRGLDGGGGEDEDPWDSRCTHVLIHAEGRAAPVACYRLLRLAACDARLSYTAQTHDVDDLSRMPGWVVEVGRFCVAPECRNPDALRLALAVMVQQADGASALFGCASFAGADPARHRAALSWLAARPDHILRRDLQHTAPPPGEAAAPAVQRFPLPPPDPAATPAGVPPLLRAYLALGARVSPEMVLDPDLGTLHLRVTLDPAAIPPARLRSLRALAAAVPG